MERNRQDDVTFYPSSRRRVGMRKRRIKLDLQMVRHDPARRGGAERNNCAELLPARYRR